MTSCCDTAIDCSLLSAHSLFARSLPLAPPSVRLRSSPRRLRAPRGEGGPLRASLLPRSSISALGSPPQLCQYRRPPGAAAPLALRELFTAAQPSCSRTLSAP